MALSMWAKVELLLRMEHDMAKAAKRGKESRMRMTQAVLHPCANCMGPEPLREKGRGGIRSFGGDGKEFCQWEQGCKAYCTGIFNGP